MNAIEFHGKAEQALRHFRGQPALQAAVTAETDAFFARYPEIERTELTAAFIGSLVLEKLSIPADSQSAQPTQKVA